MNAQGSLMHNSGQIFERFNPTADEKRDGLLYGGLTWDFDIINGTHPQNALI
ncbi:hypothetical protein PCANC_18968 [Puccinia coronata f. sp. avenae]|uniref:Uncharacterized protein n=1 Tax=Puccinia coronata f. sp. avenae TaxID=200324 RepID=A0A2N5ST74_9BASI|nr:hypothetical protein PCANC_18968 [Puccinia coronata f. sp. avenae]